MLLGRKAFDRALKFTFVRNPWDRVHSAFWFLKRGGLSDKDAAWSQRRLRGYDSFKAFVMTGLDQASVLRQVHFQPQAEFLTLTPRGPVGVDYVGYFERLEEDFDELRGLHFPDLTTGLEKKNKTVAQKGDYRDAYCDATRQKVADVYRQDIELLGYDFDSSTLPALVERRSQLSAGGTRGSARF